ncbi:MAG: radical SAM protein [Rhodospirillales bacterium]|nr:radical SAM protein [Rhodospirillales bacterium]
MAFSSQPRSKPAYHRLLQNGELAARARLANSHLGACDLCARYCRVDRTQSLKGVICRTGRNARVSSFGPHFGEEPPLVGRNGSGTIFFSWCNLRCVYCQNSDISWQGEGDEIEARDIARLMLHLQTQGCHNINLVSPSHVVAQVIEAVAIAADEGLRLPIVYNTGGYDSPETLALLDGIVDIYMPDMKYGDSDVARRLSKIQDYWAVNQAALREMHRQVGDLKTDASGIATRGILVRHLVLPNDLSGSRKVFQFLADEISPETYVNIMAQYRPCYRAGEYPELNRRPSKEEMAAAFACAREAGLTRHAASRQVPTIAKS